MSKTKNETVEAFVEPLYFQASGMEIDRVRQQISKFLDAPLPDEEHYVVGSFAETHEMIAQADYARYEELAADPGFTSILGGDGPDCAATVINISAEEHCREGPHTQSKDWKLVEATPNLDIICAGLLWLFQQSGKDRRRPGSAQYLGLFGYTTLNKTKKTIFCALWRKRQSAGQQD